MLLPLPSWISVTLPPPEPPVRGATTPGVSGDRLARAKTMGTAALTPFTYVHLVWATLAGWIVFGTFPDAWTLAGMAVITGSGLMIALHERRRAKDAPHEPTTVD